MVLFVIAVVVTLLAVRGIEQKEIPKNNRIALGVLLVALGIFTFVVIRSRLRWVAVLPVLGGAYVIASPYVIAINPTVVGIAATGIAVLAAGVAGTTTIRDRRQAEAEAEAAEAEAAAVRQAEIIDADTMFGKYARDWIQRYYETVSFPKDITLDEYGKWQHTMDESTETVYKMQSKHGRSGGDQLAAFYEIWVQITLDRDPDVISEPMRKQLSGMYDTMRPNAIALSICNLVTMIERVDWPLYKKIKLPYDIETLRKIENNIKDTLELPLTKEKPPDEVIEKWVECYTTNNPFEIDFDNLQAVKITIDEHKSDFVRTRSLVNILRSRRYDCLLIDLFLQDAPPTIEFKSQETLREFDSDIKRISDVFKCDTSVYNTFYDTIKNRHPEWKYTQGVFNCIPFLYSTYSDPTIRYQLWEKYALKLKSLTTDFADMGEEITPEDMQAWNLFVTFNYPQIPHFTYFVLMSQTIHDAIKIARACYGIVGIDQFKPLTEQEILKRLPGDLKLPADLKHCAPYTQENYTTLYKLYEKNYNQFKQTNKIPDQFEPHPYNKTADVIINFRINPLNTKIEEVLLQLTNLGIDRCCSYNFFSILQLDKLNEVATKGMDEKSAIIQGLIPSIYAVALQQYKLQGIQRICKDPNINTKTQIKTAVTQIIDTLDIETILGDVGRSGINFIQNTEVIDAPTKKYICDIIQMCFMSVYENILYYQGMQFVSQYVYSNYNTFETQYKEFKSFWKYYQRAVEYDMNIKKERVRVDDYPSYMLMRIRENQHIFNFGLTDVGLTESDWKNITGGFYKPIFDKLANLNPVLWEMIQRDTKFNHFELLQLANAAIVNTKAIAKNPPDPNVDLILHEMKVIVNSEIFKTKYMKNGIIYQRSYDDFKETVIPIIETLQKHTFYMPYTVNTGDFERAVVAEAETVERAAVAEAETVVAEAEEGSKGEITMRSVIEKTDSIGSEIPRLFKLYSAEVAPFEEGKRVLKGWLEMHYKNSNSPELAMKELAVKQGRLKERDLPIILAMTRIIKRWENEESEREWITHLKTFIHALRFEAEQQAVLIYNSPVTSGSEAALPTEG